MDADSSRLTWGMAIETISQNPEMPTLRKGRDVPGPRDEVAVTGDKPVSTAVAIISIADEEDHPIPQPWGNASVVESVCRIIESAGLACRSVVVADPDELYYSIRPGELAFPNARYFRSPRRYLMDLLDEWGIPFVGSTRNGHENITKSVMKNRLRAAGLTTPDYEVLCGTDDLAKADRFGVPLIVKPDAGSDSLGVLRLDSASTVSRDIEDLASRYGWPILAEEWCRSREFTIALLGNGDQRFAYPVEVVVPPGAYYLTEELKNSGADKTTLPLTDLALRTALTDLAQRAAVALSLQDCARIEILLDAMGRLLIIDVNTLPGLRPPGDAHQSYLLACLQANLCFGQRETVLSILAAALTRLSLPLSPALAAIWTRITEGLAPVGLH